MSYETPLVKRLRGQYGIGPENPSGEPEMGYRAFFVPPIQIEAADEIARLTNKLNADSQNFQIECQKAEIARLTAEVERLRARCGRLVREAEAWRKDFDDLVKSSNGVYGLHLNGDPSPWGELLPGGRFGGWFSASHTARDTTDAHNDLKEPTDG